MTRIADLPPIPPAPIVRILRPFQAFAENKTAGSILLLLCTVAALVLANSRWADAYTAFWHTDLTIRLGPWTLEHDLHFWVNDLLMAVFFFVVGLEIKREVLVGELASMQQAALPIAAAVGGVIGPAALYLMLNATGPGARGWGIPMATDIAFALGFMMLLGRRVPIGLKVFLTALAIVDDIAAVLVIAVFYTVQIDGIALAGAGICLAVLFTIGRLGARRPLTYAIGGMLLWLLVLASGVHATVAGVALALAIPSRTPLDFQQFIARTRSVLAHAERAADAGHHPVMNEEQLAAMHALEEACEKVQPPLHRMEHALHPWVAFVIMPVFALANAGLVLSGDIGAALTHPVALGIMAGLVLGKPLGVMLASWLAVRAGLASLPSGVTWRHIHGAGWLAGIGFTMSLFVAGLAFTDSALLATAKLGVMIASACAAIVGCALLVQAHRSSTNASRDISRSAPVEERPAL
jgi:Na+:H+ antiporter, NhaA family